MSDWILRDAFELALVLAVGGVLFATVRRLKQGNLPVVQCGACGRPISRAYAACPKCGAAQS